MNKSPANPASVSSFASAAASTAFETDKDQDGGNNNCHDKPRILCLHGGFQSGSIFSNKISGARRKLAREYELDFLDGPILMPQNNDEGVDAAPTTEDARPRWWWRRSEDGQHVLVREAFDYVVQQTESEKYDAIIGFSQGGTLATALTLSGALPNVRAVVTSGAPYSAEAFKVAAELSSSSFYTPLSAETGFDVPKFHFAGETDAVVAVSSTRELCEKGGTGTFVVHDQGHLFPTRAARVREVLEFLETALS